MAIPPSPPAAGWLVIAALAAGWGSEAMAQARTQRRIGTAEEFAWPGTSAPALRTVAGITDADEVVGSVRFEIFEFPGTSSIGATWTLDDGFTYIQPSAALGPPLSLHQPQAYPYDNADQHGFGFLSAEPGGERIAHATDNRTETAGFTGLNTRDPISTSWFRRWSGGPGPWLPFANNPTSASSGMQFDLEFYDFGRSRVFPGGHIVVPGRRTPSVATNYSASPPYWLWEPDGPNSLLDFRISPGGSPEEYLPPAGWPSGNLTEYSVNRHGQTVGVATRLLPGSLQSEWQGVLWPAPGDPRSVAGVVGVPNAFPVHITEAGEIAGVIPARTTPVDTYLQLEEGRLFLWLPVAKWGLPAGMNYLTAEGSKARLLGMNDRGMMVFVTDLETAPAYFTWVSGSLRPWSFTSETWSEIVPTGLINNKGALLAYGVRADNGSVDYVFSYPVLDMDLTVDPDEIPLCQEFDLVAKVTNRSVYTVNGFTQSASPESAGEASAVVVSGPTPSGPQSIPSGATVEFRWRCRGSQLGEARFAVEMRGTATNGSVYRTLKSTSEPVTITRPELIVNRPTDEPADPEHELCGDIDHDEPGLQITLRSAIQAANALEGEDVIEFDLPPASNKTIVLGSPLPPVTEACEIRGSSQPGGALVAIDAQGAFLAVTNQAALEARADVVFESLAVTGATAGNVALKLSDGLSVVRGCRFGFGADGALAGSNLAAIQVLAGGQRIGGAGAGEGNRFGRGNIGILVGNTEGTAVVADTVVEGNVFGQLDSSFSKQGPVNGVAVINGTRSRIGGPAAGARNHFRCSNGAAVVLAGPQCTDNEVSGNWMGLTEAGAGVFSPDRNGYGVALSQGAHHNRIGGDTPGAGNVICSSESAGILLTRGVHDNVIIGNWIGPDASGNDSAPNETGILALSGNHNRIGGPTPGQRNVISGNRGSGVIVGRPPDLTFKSSDVDPGAELCTDTLIEGNWIGLDASGTRPLPNGAISYRAFQGVMVGRQANGTIIGGATPGRSNVISGNNSEGIRIDADPGTAHAIWGNHVGSSVDGLTPQPNRAAGIVVVGEAVVQIGGTTNFTPNRIAWNGGPGIDLRNMNGNVPGLPLAGNLIHDNAPAGSIALANTRSANDSGDADSGPNGLQNWPLLVAAANLSATATNVVFDLSSFPPGIPTRIDLFKASGGGGSEWIGSKQVTTGTDPDDRYLADVALQFVGAEITALATTSGGTSEFSPPVKVVSGADSDLDGVPDAVENQVPGAQGGDRNADGIPDAAQSKVSSAEVPGGGWLTLAAGDSQSLSDLVGLRPADLPRLPEGFLVQPGAVGFRVGGTGSSGPMSLWLPPQASPPTLWIRGGTGWTPLAGVTVQAVGALWKLTFTLPADPSDGDRLLAVGQAAPPLTPPVLTLLPLEWRPADPVLLGVAGIAPDSGQITPPGMIRVQPLLIPRPPQGTDWRLESSADLLDWQTESGEELVFPASPGRFFRWARP
jgi:hypothetical protein